MATGAEGTVFFLVVSIIAMLVTGLIARSLRMPAILGILLAGTLLGPFSPLAGHELIGFPLDSLIVKEMGLVEAFATLGAILLLFQIGLEFSIARLTKLGGRALVAAFIKIGVLLFLGFETARTLLGFGTTASLFVGVLLSMSSTPIIVRFLREHDMMDREETPLVIGILIIEDVYAAFSLAVLSDMAGGASVGGLLFTMFKTAVIFGFAYVALTPAIRWFFKYFARDTESSMLASIALGVGMGLVSGVYLGIGAAVGAFIAGSILAGMEEARRVGADIQSFNILFSAIFFFSIGMSVDLLNVWANIYIAIALTLVAVVGKFGASVFGTYLVGGNGKSAVFVGISLLTLSEISLLVAQKGIALGVVPQSVLGVASAVLFLTVIITSLLFGREEAVYKAVTPFIPSAFKRSAASVNRGIAGLFSAVDSMKNGTMHPEIWWGVQLKATIDKETSRIASALRIALVAIAAALVLRGTLPEPFPLAVSVAAALASGYALVSLFLGLGNMLKFLFDFAVRQEGNYAISFMKNTALCVAFLLLGLSAPLVEEITKINYAALVFFLASMAVSAFYLRGAASRARRFLSR